MEGWDKEKFQRIRQWICIQGSEEQDPQGLNLPCGHEVQFEKYSKNADGKDKGKASEAGYKL